jgi:hypothetical protein
LESTGLAGGIIDHWFGKVLRFVTGESLLDRQSNGSTVIVRRALRTTLFLYAPVLLLAAFLQTGFGSGPDWQVLREVARDTLPWAGAIFAGTYAALYARFSSQWSYLAATYNQFMQAQIESSSRQDSSAAELYIAWKAAILEDACELHLATKPMFAPLVAEFLADPDVVSAFRRNTVHAQRHLDRLRKALPGVLNRPLTIADGAMHVPVGVESSSGNTG